MSDTHSSNNNSQNKKNHNNFSDGKIFTVFAVCTYGLEEKLSEELKTIGFNNIVIEKSGCTFKSNLLGIQYANLHSRIASRILMQIEKNIIDNEKDILDISAQVRWDEWFDIRKTIKIKTIGYNTKFQSIQYCTLLVKDGICDYFRKIYNSRPNIDKQDPDIQIYSFIKQNTFTLYIDSSGESLFKRGWRMNKGTAPIKENLAAGLLALSGWTPEYSLLDPFCGSGTIIIEAAHIACSIPPGISRKFAFEKLNFHNNSNWNAVLEEASTNINRTIEAELIGCDIDKTVLEYAKINLSNSGINNNNIKFVHDDACNIKVANHNKGFIVTNPPYGERTCNEDIWYSWSHNLKENFFNWDLNIISNDMSLPGKMRLKPKRKIPIFNGKLECRLFKFEIVKNSYRTQK
ncbi:THUMP domain-containing class I SAM-dependent RNA methyltransferase [Candidatus Kinetoplastidibacterium crithidiae]|uniref:Putative N6-adenine-specific DNA methylase n=1 Tax=Candidatus Kinetoplastidibacterium crithidiae TCC036E TaxID=1208918 RepID=M1LUE8_9PROT|nr:class I SAM-dependent RNA methyltransferase [Candidatus Kinetoplastibacterium crithidii]AFZ82612.1 N6-adenine-specific DNA methylase [Candidatus Kinetoplastibacterium crithidii (ex Angomonas deanei ATCC 30255)]AGF47726.1 putative N6-adenine-specific DNA methylase [Candidatus Kinetoplastibacterium crithidii TCC036E]